jgi:hypothetical protein
VEYPFAEREVVLPRVIACTGVIASLVVPSPSWPWLLRPQQ